MGIENANLGMLILSNTLDIEVKTSNKQLGMEFRDTIKAEDMLIYEHCK